jgi:hypothetical protein
MARLPAVARADAAAAAARAEHPDVVLALRRRAPAASVR